MSFGGSTVSRQHLDVAPWGGDETGFMENFHAAWDDENLRQAANGLEVAFEDKYNANWARYQNLAGDTSPDEFIRRSTFMRVAREQQGVEEDTPDNVFTRALASGVPEHDIDEKSWGTLKKRDEAISIYKQFNPDDDNVKTLAELWNDVKRENRQFMNVARDVGSRSTFMGGVGSFTASVAAAVNPRTNFFNFATLGIGGVGTTFVPRLLTEMGAGSTIEAINQFTGVAERQALLGTKNTLEQQLTQIAMAGVGAGALRSAAEGSGVLARVGEQKLAPDRAAGREMLRIAEATKLERVKVDDAILRMDPRRMNEGPNRTPDLNLAAEQSRILFNRANPFGDTDLDQELHVSRFMDMMEPIIVSLRDRLNGSTSVPAPVIRAEFTQPDYTTTRYPTKAVNTDPDVAYAAREINPTLINEFERLQAHNRTKSRWLDEMGDSKLAAETDAALAHLDERIARLEVERDRTSSAKSKKQKQQEIDALRAQGEEIIAAPRGGDTPSMARLRNEIIETDKQLRDMSEEVGDVYEKARKKVDARKPGPRPAISGAGRRAVDSILDRQEIRAADPIRSMLEAADPHMINGKSLHTFAQDMSEELKRTDPNIAAHNDAEVQSVMRTIDDEANTIDLGSEVGEIDLDNTYVQLADVDSGGSVTLREFLDEGKYDDELVQSMTTCSIGVGS